ncbi:pyruvate, phosphate dikinase [Salaquimonas pukyongi]|uniref:pyruvate, phosphate dikinase n=1 Tax=Salaquimonas pukyongi TaxID=2712698 RepID=UPI00096B9261|nr:pyruvate, phosphate dikinase [Salaquimonas pukyongi]
MTKWVYSFEHGKAEGDAMMTALLGGKGAHLAEMSSLDLAVPPGFTITTGVCDFFYANGKQLPPDLDGQVEAALERLKAVTGRTFGDAQKPLLVSVRSGSRASMPGMMDTVLNLGLNDVTVESMAAETGDKRFAYDCYRRFIQMYGDVVMGVDHELFEEIIDNAKADAGHDQDTGLDADDWLSVIARYKALIREELDEDFPQDPRLQLAGAIKAVFASWMNQRAIVFRSINNIPKDWGTAVNVQAMVFGNRGEQSATGVCFSRNPSTGKRGLYGEFLVNAQGEDVVAGIRTPQDLTEEARLATGSDRASLEKLMPDAFEELERNVAVLERHYRDMQDVEFTIEDGKVWLLQTRSGKRTAKAALRIAVDMAEEGVISRSEAVCAVEPATLDQLLHPTISEGAERDVIAQGLPASPGAATGEIVFNPDEAEKIAAQDRPVILVRVETSPEDIHGMNAAQGILTQRGGMTSHAAVVARGMGKPCVSGAGMLKVDYKNNTMTSNGRVFHKGDVVTLDGGKGQVLSGNVEMEQPELSGAFGTIMEWADEVRRMRVRTNADTPKEARAAHSFGAEGIGLCRTEHMFFEEDRITPMREMIIADTEAERREALAKLLPMQRADFVELFEIMAGMPVTIRLIDPPLHEFLPHEDSDVEAVAKGMGIDPDKLKMRATALREFNPMLGHRGCRLLISHPEIAEMQARAIFEAAIEAGKRTGNQVIPEVMVPLVSLKRELDHVKATIDRIAVDVENETGVKLNYQVGTMIELPRAAIRAGEIAEVSEFFSFGTNDLTQTTFGISRDDATQFVPTYEAQGVVDRDPFISLDLEGVGDLMRIAAERGRETREELKLGICGEHGGDPISIHFCESIELDYVSCSPFRVPIARLAAAQAAVRHRAGKTS